MAKSTTEQKNYLIPTLIIGVIFFALGFITWVNSTLIPYLQKACELTTSQAVLVTFASYIAYAVMAFPSSWVLSKTGFKNGMVVGLLIMAIGAFVFVPAAHSRSYMMFLIGIFVIGIGMAVLQTAANPFITILGPIDSAAKRISIMGICNKTAGILAPLVMGTLLLNGMDKYDAVDSLPAVQKELMLNELASKIIIPYIFIGIAFIIVAVAIKMSSLPDISAEKDEEVLEKSEAQAIKSINKKDGIFSYGYLWLGFITLFLYVGCEVCAGDLIIKYGSDKEMGLGISTELAKHFTSYTMVGMLAGYILGIICIPKYIKQHTALTISAILAIVLSLGVVYLPGEKSIICLALLGFANAQMWPAIWPLSIHGLGKYLKTGSALLIIAISGGAIIPKLWANIAEHIHNMQHAFWILIPCYIFILFFSTIGYKIGKKQK